MPRQLAVDVIDGARVDYALGNISRGTAIETIRSAVDVTELGAEDLLDHRKSARERYASAFVGSAGD